jgi:tetratricopeptide (TPR) repeat protein
MDSAPSRKAEEVFAALLDLDESERVAALDQLHEDDPGLVAEVRALLGSLPAVDAYFDQYEKRLTDNREPWQGRRAGPYRIVAEIGRGGMGAVYKAERDDGQFQLEVAVKFVSVLAAGGEAWKRFEQEKRILATLRHPNIAQLLDAGVNDEGVPYTVMELVDGAPIDVYCRDSELDVRTRIRLFLQVCDAVDFIHRNLIIHRDIKPGNILVTVDGTAKLLDFGISRVLSANFEADVTAPERRLMTLNYSSPEQVRGDAVTTSSDIYSLGLLLYELLAGRPAFSLSGLSTQEMLRRVTEQDPPSPGKVAPSSSARELSGDLDQIVMKAIRKTPAERYASARELAADLEKYLAGRPVSAVALTKGYRLRKWVGRHRVPVAAGTVAALALIAGAAGIVWEMRVAQHQRALAEQRFNDVRKLANSIMFEFQDGISHLAGSTEVRRAMVTRSLEYLDSVAGADPRNVALQVELATGYMRLGNVQGNPAVANLGDRAGALSSFAKARRTLEAALAVEPQHRTALVKLGEVLTGTQYLLQSDGQGDAALEMGRKSVVHWERVAQSLPSDDDVRSGLAAAYFGMATSFTLGWSERMEFWNRTQSVYEALLRERPTDTNRMRNAALVHKYMSGMYSSSLKDAVEDFNQAFDHAQAAVELDKRRTEALPEDSQVKLDLAFSLSMLATASLGKDDLVHATQYAAQSIEIRRALWEADPKDHQARDRLANALARIGDLYWRQDDGTRAISAFREAVQHAKELTRISNLWATWDTLAFSHWNLAQIAESRSSSDACTEWKLAAPAMKHVMKVNPGSGTFMDYPAEWPQVEQKLAACTAGKMGS